MNILESASKIVFILMAVGVVGLTYLKIVEPNDYLMLAGMAFAFYFSNKGETNKPMAGK